MPCPPYKYFNYKVDDPDELPRPKLEAINGTCASVRLDSLISLAFKASRSSMVSYIEGGQVFVNGKLITSNGYEPKEGDIISVRGKGRFIFDGMSHQTKREDAVSAFYVIYNYSIVIYNT